MKRILISALLVSASLATVPAFAQSSLTRSEVKAQLVQAENSGQLTQQHDNNDYPVNQAANVGGASNTLPFGATDASTDNGHLTRAEVKRELAAAREAGVVPSNEFNYPYDFNKLTASQRTALSQANPNRASSAQD